MIEDYCRECGIELLEEQLDDGLCPWCDSEQDESVPED